MNSEEFKENIAKTIRALKTAETGSKLRFTGKVQDVFLKDAEINSVFKFFQFSGNDKFYSLDTLIPIIERGDLMIEDLDADNADVVEESTKGGKRRLTKKSKHIKRRKSIRRR
jgi:hypothetical protein